MATTLTFDTVGLYVKSKTTIAEKIVALDQVISALIDAQIDAIDTSTMSQYSLNDGQVQISSVYRNPTELAKAIDMYMKLRERLINQINGRKRRLMDWRNFRGYNY